MDLSAFAANELNNWRKKNAFNTGRFSLIALLNKAENQTHYIQTGEAF